MAHFLLTRRVALTTVASLPWAMAVSACSKREDGPVAWEALDVGSLTLVRQEPSPHHEFHFQRGGTVGASFIQPNGLVVAPLLYWRIEGKALLLSEVPGGPAMVRLADPTMKDGELLVREASGQQSRFKIKAFF